MLHQFQKDVYHGNVDTTLATGDQNMAPLLIIFNKNLHYTELYILKTSKLKNKTQGKLEGLIRSENFFSKKKTKNITDKLLNLWINQTLYFLQILRY